MKRVLCIIADGFEEIEMITPVDLLRRGGVEVVIAAIDSFHVTGRNGITVHADGTLDEFAGQPFDLLLLPGGPGVKALRADGRAAEWARKFDDLGKPVAAICAAPTILKDAGLLEGKSFTGHQSIKEELPALIEHVKVVRDENLITSRGAGTALQFGLALVEILCGEEKQREVASSIHW